MTIQSARFIKGITGTEDILYDGKFQVAFMGRSNVGKSSLINSLLLKRSLVRTSSSPGKTIRMDFFLINDSFYFVDFPGYGFARTSGKGREKLRKMILWYLEYSKITNRLIVMVIDASVEIKNFDCDMLAIIREQKIDHIIVANKIDKLNPREQKPRLESIQKTVGDSPIIPYSSLKKIGRDALLLRLTQSLTMSAIGKRDDFAG